MIKRLFCSFIYGCMLVGAAVASSAPALAQAGNESGVNPLEMEQLQAQVDVMLEEMSELQGYRFCGEQGLIYEPNSPDADEGGCVTPVKEQPTLTAPRIVGGELAPTAKTFKLGASPRGTKSGENIPLKSIGAAAPAKAPQPSQASQGQSLQNMTTSMEKPQPTSERPRAVEPIPALEAQYPNDRVRALVEMAVAQALEGGSQAAGGVAQASESVRNAPMANVQPSVDNNATATEGLPMQSAQGALIPSCADGEFLTVMGGEVVCRRAAAAGKMACPPAVLRTYVDWHDQHIHFHYPYTPHGQQRTAQENSDIMKVECDNGTYKMVEITRNECGGGSCREGRKPAYSMTYYCNQDKTKRCYAKQNGHLVNHTYSRSYINKQY